MALYSNPQAVANRLRFTKYSVCVSACLLNLLYLLTLLTYYLLYLLLCGIEKNFQGVSFQFQENEKIEDSINNLIEQLA